jgi:hypothetical protein
MNKELTARLDFEPAITVVESQHMHVWFMEDV